MSSEAEQKDPKEKEKPKEPEYVAVGPGAEEEEGEKLALDQDDDADEKEDSRLASEDDEDKPRRPKETAKERRERQKKQRSRERQELDFYRTRNEQLEKQWAQRMQQIEGRQEQLSHAAIDQRIGKIEEHLALADNVSFEAMKAGTRDDYAKAQGIRDQLNQELARLRFAKTQGQQQRPTQEQQVPEEDPVVRRNREDWLSDNEWFDPSSRAKENMIVRALDESVTEDGFNPRTSEYWEELTKRVRDTLPSLFKKQKTNGRYRVEVEDDDADEDADMPRQQRPSGPKFSSGGRERTLRKGEVYVSAERKKALKDAGMWDDGPLRQRMLKRYAQMDEELSSSRTN